MMQGIDRVHVIYKEEGLESFSEDIEDVSLAEGMLIIQRENKMVMINLSSVELVEVFGAEESQ